MVDIQLSMQLSSLNLNYNVMTGTLPGSWGNLTSVSHCLKVFVSLIHVAAPASSAWLEDPASFWAHMLYLFI